MHRKGRPQSTSFPLDHRNLELAGKPKRTKRVLKVRGLWSERCLALERPAAHNRPSCNSKGGFCIRRVLEEEGIFEIRKDAYRRRQKH